MVQTQNKLLDDLARLSTGAAGALHGLKAEVEGVARQKLDRLLAGLDLVSREEFEAVKEMAIAARAETEALKVRLAALEETLGKRPRDQKKTQD